MSEDLEPAIIDKLILLGALEVGGVEEDGRFTYRFTEQAKDLAPELYNSFLNNFYQGIMTLWEKGFLNMEVSDENPLVTPTEKCFNVNEIMELDISEQKALQFILESMKANKDYN